MPNKDRDRERAYQHQYYLDHRADRIAKANARQIEKKIEVRASRKKRYWSQEGFREREVQRLTAHRAQNKDRLNAEARIRYQLNLETERARDAAYRKANPDQMRTRVIRRRARLAGAVGHHTTQEWQEKKTLFAFCCAYCGEQKPLHREHDIPIARGGSNSITNVLPSCALCNARKGLRTAREFLGLPERRVPPLR